MIIKSIIKLTFTMLMFVAGSVVVYADGYFLWGTSSTVSSWGGSNAASGSGPWTVTLTGLTAKQKYYIGYSTSSSKDNLASISSVGTTSGLQNSGTQDDWYNSSQKRFVWFETSSATSVTISCSEGYQYDISPACTESELTVTTPANSNVTIRDNVITVAGSTVSGYSAIGAVSACGIEIGTSEGNVVKNPTSASATFSTVINTGIGGQASTTPAYGTTYHYRAYATNCLGTYYGSWATFSPARCSLGAPSATGVQSITPDDAQYVLKGNSITYTVVPTSGFDFKTRNYSGSTDGSIVKSDNSFTFYPTTDGTFSVTYDAPGTDKPTVRIGEEIVQDLDLNVVVSAYVTSQKCYDVDQIVVYYSNNSAFRTEEDMQSRSKSFDDGPYALRETHALTLSKSEVAAIVDNGGTLYVRLKAHNAHSGYSDYSDVVSLVYLNNNFITTDKNIGSVDACDGSHEFTWEDMFVPTPTSYTVIDNETGESAFSEFTLTADGQMVWNVVKSIEGGVVNIKDNGTYTYTFTGKRTGYTPASATFTVTLNSTGTKDEITTGITFNSEGVKTEDGSLTPWETATLGATESSGDIEKIGWTVSPVSDSYILTPTEGTSVKFKAKRDGEYTVTARGLTSTCGSSPAKQIKLTVSKDSEPCKP